MVGCLSNLYIDWRNFMIKKDRSVLTKEFLMEEYVKNKKTYQQIAEETGLTKWIVLDQAKILGIKSRSSGRSSPNLLGRRFGSLLVIEKKSIIESKTGKKRPEWICKCDCGNIKKAGTSELLRGQKTCWDCRNKYISKIKWRGHGKISGEFWGKIKNSAEVRNYRIEITIEDIWDLFVKQNGKCALTGVELKIYRHHKDRSRTTASLDRIDSSKHYVLDNIQWVHKKINNIKMDLSQDEFIEWCKKVVLHVNPGIGKEKINTSS
jgi:hypothetical protein